METDEQKIKIRRKNKKQRENNKTRKQYKQEIPSGPVALFVFKAISFFATSPYDALASFYGTGLDVVVSAWCCRLMVSASFIPTVAKKQFNKLAFSSASPRIVSFK